MVSVVSRFLRDTHEQGENSARAGDVFSQVLASGSQNLLADDSERLAGALIEGRERGEERIDIVVDNAGGRKTCLGSRRSAVIDTRVGIVRKKSRFGRLRIKSR